MPCLPGYHRSGIQIFIVVKHIVVIFKAVKNMHHGCWPGLSRLGVMHLFVFGGIRFVRMPDLLDAFLAGTFEEIVCTKARFSYKINKILTYITGFMYSIN